MNTPRCLAHKVVLLTLLFSFCARPALSQAGQPPAPQVTQKSILLLYSYGHGGRGVAVLDDGLVATLNAGGISANNLFFEYLDLERNKADKGHAAYMREFLLRKYSGRKIDLIVTVQQPARDFVLHEGKTVAPEAPVISIQATPIADAEAGNRQFVSLLTAFDVKGTLERALELFPQTERVVFVSGNSGADRKMAAQVESAAADKKRKLEFEYTSDLTFDEMLSRVASLPARSVIIFIQYNSDIHGRAVLAYEAEEQIVKAANAPVFGLYDFNLINGGIGGSVVSVRGLGEKTAQVALAILQGKRQLTQRVTNESIDTVPTFNWSQIERWGGLTDALPKASVFVNRRPTTWEQYSGYIIGAAVLILVQSLMIGALVVSKRRRRLVEDLLRESEERHRLLFDTSIDAILLTAPDGRILAANPAACAMFKRTEEEIRQVGRGGLADQSDPRLAKALEERSRTGSFAGELTFIRKDGSSFPCELSTTVFKDAGGSARTSMIIRDISERKRAGEVLIESESRLSAVFHASPIGITVSRVADGTILDANDAALRLYGYTRDEVIGRTAGELGTYANPAQREELVQRLRNGGGVEHFRIDFRRKGGDVGVMEISGRVIELQSEHALVAMMLDVTEQIRSEKEKAILESQFQQAQKMESVGRLAGGVAHDFNNMLTVILGNVAMAIEQVDTTQPIHTDLMEIRKAASRSADLTRQLLAFSRKQVVEPKVLDLNATIPGIIKMLQRLIGEGIELKWLPGAGLWPVKVDPSQMDQVLSNLCINARDAIAGVGDIVIETGNSTFDEEYCALHSGFVPGDYVRLSVSDNGRGIDKEILAHIFEPFFTTKGAGEGTGLGLATVYGVVKQNNGFINVYSESEAGTTFTLYLPRHTGGQEHEQAKTVTEPAVRGHETILLVEDEPSILKLTERILERQGYTVLSAKNPSEAVRLASEHARPIHLLITDVVMPEMNGRDLAKNLQSFYSGLKLLFMSGYTANIIVHQGVLDKGVNFIQKPFSIDDLAAKVREVLDTE